MKALQELQAQAAMARTKVSPQDLLKASQKASTWKDAFAGALPHQASSKHPQQKIC